MSLPRLRPRSGRPGCVALFLMPFVVGALAMSGCVAHAARLLSQSRAHQARASFSGLDGPVVLDGELVGPPGGQRIEGDPGPGPVVRAFDLTRREGKTRRMFCRDFLANGVSLRLAGGELVALDELLPAEGLRWTTGASSTLASGGSFEVGSVSEPQVPPAAIGAHCKSHLGGAELASLQLAERVVPDGTRVKVVACKRGERLAACHDGLDAVIAGTLEDLVATKIDVRALRFGALWNALVLSFLGWLLLGLLPRAPGQNGPPRADTREGGDA